jgi:hypothetical protein
MISRMTSRKPPCFLCFDCIRCDTNVSSAACGIMIALLALTHAVICIANGIVIEVAVAIGIIVAFSIISIYSQMLSHC